MSGGDVGKKSQGSACPLILLLTCAVFWGAPISALLCRKEKMSVWNWNNQTQYIAIDNFVERLIDKT
jgi:hypothetical protein